MRKSKWIMVLSLLAILMLVLTACGGSKATEAPEQGQPTDTQSDAAPQATNTTPPAEAPPPTDPPAPTDTSEPETAGDTELDAAGLSEPLDLSSYRSTMNVIITGIADGQEFQESINFVIEYTSDPLAQRISMSGSGFGDAEGMDNFEMYLVKDTMYMKMGEEWLSMPAEEGEMISEGMLTPDTLVEDTCGWQKKEKTKIDGVAVQHWTISQKDMEKCMPPEQLAQMGELTSASGDIYIAEDGDYVVQMDMFYEGTNLDLGIEATEEAVQDGRMEIHFKITDVNQPISIVLPEAAVASSSTPEDIPLPDDAQEVSNMFGMITFTSASTPQELAEFYQAQMPNYGWSELSAEEMGDLFMLEYTKENRTVSLMINSDDSGQTSVLITVEGEE